MLAVEGLLARFERDALTDPAAELRPLYGLVEQLHRQARAMTVSPAPSA